MAYGIWCKKLDKWMIDGYDSKNPADLLSL